jgi:hypothetical protein
MAGGPSAVAACGPRSAVRIGSTSGGSPASARSPVSRTRSRVAGQRSASTLGSQQRVASTEHVEASREYARIRSDYAASNGNTVGYGENTPTITTSVGALTADRQRGPRQHQQGREYAAITTDYGGLAGPEHSRRNPVALRAAQTPLTSERWEDGKWGEGLDKRQRTRQQPAQRSAWPVEGVGCQRLRIRCEHVATTQRRQENA